MIVKIKCVKLDYAIVVDEGDLITLYASPSDEKPYVQFAGLQKGKYIEVDYLSIRTFICFSDVGSSARKACLNLDKNTTCTLISYSWLEEDRSWIVSIENSKISILLNSQRYKHFGKYVDAFFISMGISGKEDVIKKFAGKFLEILGRKPYEDLHWKRLEEKQKIKKEDVIRAWEEIID